MNTTYIKIKREITWFDKYSDNFIGAVELSNTIDVSMLQQHLSTRRGCDENLFDVYEIYESEKDFYSQFLPVNFKFEFSKYQYFLEATGMYK